MKMMMSNYKINIAIEIAPEKKLKYAEESYSKYDR